MNEIQDLPGAAATFSEFKQLAIFGWCLKDKVFAAQLLGALKPEWFSSSHISKLFKVAQKSWHKLNRLIELEELKTSELWEKEDPRDVAKCMDLLEKALKATEKYGVDILGSEMTKFIHGAVFQQGMTKAVDLFNNRDIDAAWKAIEDSYTTKTTVTFEDGMNRGFRDSKELIIEEEDERIAQSTQLMSYGVKFLDDALGAIIPNDLIVLGAKTGAGKTSLAQSIALHVAQKYPVHYFALEAENFEIERRIKYGMVSKAYHDRYPGAQPLSYKRWRMNQAPDAAKAIEHELNPEYKEKVKNLKTFYRTSNAFDEAVLEQSLMRIVKETKLIIIDHLHYIDVMGNDENAGYKSITKTIRDIALKYNVPIILIAHLRKTQGGARFSPLIPSIEDFHGTSDITKIATACIMLGPAYDEVGPRSFTWPTYVGIVKSRMEGSVTRFTSLCYFDYSSMSYLDQYKLGKLSDMNQQFDPIAPDNTPWWAEGAKMYKDKVTDSKISSPQPQAAVA